MKKLLIVIDYQNDFVDGSLGFQDAKLIEEYIVNLIDEYHQNNQDVIFTLDTHQDNYLKSQEGINLPIVHCIDGTSGHQLYGKVKQQVALSDKIFKKPTFGSLDLGIYLKDKDYDEITIVGVVSNICVISNAIIAKAALPEAKIIIDCKGIASNDIALQNKAIDILSNLQCIIINQ